MKNISYKNNIWREEKLGDLCDILIGGTPSRNKKEYWDGGNNIWVSIRDLTNNNFKYIVSSSEKITDLGVKKSNVKLIPENTLIMSFKLSIGKVSITGKSLYTNEAIAAFKVLDTNKLDSNYLYYFLPTVKFDSETAVKGATLNKEKLKKIDILFPDIKIQQKIALILSTVDEEIQKTDQIIGKTEKIKNGLMDELLIKGIGHTKFKKTKIGEIPSSWEIILLDEVARRGTGHTPNKKYPSYWNGGIKWVSLSDTFRLDNVYISNTSKQISQEGINYSSAVIHPKGTVILSRDAGVGKSSIITEQMAVSQHFIAWICSDRLNNLFLYYYLQKLKPVFENIAIGSTIKTIGMPFFKKLEILLPEIDEQKKIANILYSLDEKIKKEARYKEELIDLKNGLMNDIFNQKVEVR